MIYSNKSQHSGRSIPSNTNNPPQNPPPPPQEIPDIPIENTIPPVPEICETKPIIDKQPEKPIEIVKPKRPRKIVQIINKFLRRPFYVLYESTSYVSYAYCDSES